MMFIGSSAARQTLLNGRNFAEQSSFIGGGRVDWQTMFIGKTFTIVPPLLPEITTEIDE